MGILSFIFGKNDNQSAIGKQVKLRAEEFVVSYGEKYKGLDYSVQSLTELDYLLGELKSWVDLSDDERNGIITNAASYILWVAKQQYNSIFYWSEKHAQPVLVIGEPDYRIALIAQDKVLNRIEKKDSDIRTFYNKLKDRVQTATRGSD